MSYLYDEVTSDERTALRTHLEACASCRQQIETWQSARGALDEFTLPAKPKSITSPAVVRWAAAAALAGLLTFGILHVAALHRDVRQLRADLQGSFRREMETQMRLDLAQQMRADVERARADWNSRLDATGADAKALVAALAQRFETQRAADQQATLAAFQALTASQARDYAALRGELETVAVLTEAGLQRAETRIATLADFSGNSSNNH